MLYCKQKGFVSKKVNEVTQTLHILVSCKRLTNTNLLMPSGVFTSFKLDPFFQQFLRSYFDQSEELVFHFPKGEDLLRKLEVLLRPVPENYKPRKHDWLFHVELPYMKYKDPRTHNYLSETSGKIFARNIRDFFETVFHEKVSEYRNAGFEYKDCVYIFMEEFHLPVSATDRLIKDFQRYRNRIRYREYYKKRKSKSVLA
jgi:hypothetical protein